MQSPFRFSSSEIHPLADDSDICKFQNLWLYDHKYKNHHTVHIQGLRQCTNAVWTSYLFSQACWRRFSVVQVRKLRLREIKYLLKRIHRQAVLRRVLRFKPGSFLKSKLVATAFYCHRVSSSSILKFCDLIVPEKMRGGVEINRWSVSILDLTQKNYFCFIDYTKVFDCVDHNKLENS